MKLYKIPAAVFIGLWLTACSQTTATRTEAPSRQETGQEAPSGSSTASEKAQAEQQETPQKSASAKTQTATAETGQQESSSPPTPESEKVPAAKQAGSGQPASQARSESSPESALEKARENLRLSEQTEKRIAADLEQLKKSGKASDEAISDYENYLDSVRAMTAENRNVVAQMEAAYADKSSGQTAPLVPTSKELKKPADPSIPEEQTMDEVAKLDRELDASLAKFDDMLLNEMEKIQSESKGKLQELAQEAAEAAKRLREKGLGLDTSGAGSAEDAGKESEGQAASGPEQTSSKGNTGTETASSESARKGGEGTSVTDQHRKDYGDDDIVARQLREAAENEADPELKAKLWKEYEEYKKSK
jgi:hypothetical protein